MADVQRGRSCRAAGLGVGTGGRRDRAWAAARAPDGELLVIDMDATIVTTRADKGDAAPTLQAHLRSPPVVGHGGDCGEVLAGCCDPATLVEHRSGTTWSSWARPSIFPELWAAGHRRATIPTTPPKSWWCADAGGATHWLAEECRDRNIGFSLGYAIDGRVRDASAPHPRRPLAARSSLTAPPVTAPRSSSSPTWSTCPPGPEGTRLIARAQRPHPGAQLTLFDTIEGMRHTAFICDHDDDPATLELFQRQRARAENVIRDTKACGPANLPFDDVVNNDVDAAVLLRPRPACLGPEDQPPLPLSRRATPKTLRHRLLSTSPPHHPTNQRLDLDRTWPWTTTLLDALHRLRAASHHSP